MNIFLNYFFDDLVTDVCFHDPIELYMMSDNSENIILTK